MTFWLIYAVCDTDNCAADPTQKHTLFIQTVVVNNTFVQLVEFSGIVYNRTLLHKAERLILQ